MESKIKIKTPIFYNYNKFKTKLNSKLSKINKKKDYLKMLSKKNLNDNTIFISNEFIRNKELSDYNKRKTYINEYKEVKTNSINKETESINRCIELNDKLSYKSLSKKKIILKKTLIEIKKNYSKFKKNIKIQNIKNENLKNFLENNFIFKKKKSNIKSEKLSKIGNINFFINKKKFNFGSKSNSKTKNKIEESKTFKNIFDKKNSFYKFFKTFKTKENNNYN